MATKHGVLVQECPTLLYMFVQKTKNSRATAATEHIMESTTLKTVENEVLSILATG